MELTPLVTVTMAKSLTPFALATTESRQALFALTVVVVPVAADKVTQPSVDTQLINGAGPDETVAVAVRPTLCPMNKLGFFGETVSVVTTAGTHVVLLTTTSTVFGVPPFDGVNVKVTVPDAFGTDVATPAEVTVASEVFPLVQVPATGEVNVTELLVQLAPDPSAYGPCGKV